MQKNSISTIAKFIIKFPRRLPVLLQKLFLRFIDFGKTDTDYHWILQQQTDFENWASEINSELWLEAKQFSNKFQLEAIEKISRLPFSMGGGGIYPILYFLTRLYRPKVILETGVAAGYSSNTFLCALKKNNFGSLYSSDFPYFRVKNPERYIGILVEEELKNGWNLFIEGDRINLPLICNNVDKIDIFHYDSDKSYTGRNFAFNTIRSKIHKDSILVFDDIQDNNYFKDFVQKHQCNFKIFLFQRKYVGMVFDLNLK